MICKIKKNNSVEEKLKLLYNIQLIDSRIDEIKKFRENIPIEINISEIELDNIKNNLKNIQTDIFSIKKDIENKNENIKKSEILIKKYENKKNNIKSNKELHSIDKEIEFQKLEIQLFRKKIKELSIKILEKKNVLEKIELTIKNKKKHISYKKEELNNILIKNNKEEKILYKHISLFYKKIEDKLLQSYKKIRNRMKNGIAVSPVERGAPLGSYLSITPQKYYELMQRKKILIDEHSGRILIDSELAKEEKKKSVVFKYEKKNN